MLPRKHPDRILVSFDGRVPYFGLGAQSVPSVSGRRDVYTPGIIRCWVAAS